MKCKEKTQNNRYLLLIFKIRLIQGLLIKNWNFQHLQKYLLIFPKTKRNQLPKKNHKPYFKSFTLTCHRRLNFNDL
jgi:hypothetical protein